MIDSSPLTQSASSIATVRRMRAEPAWRLFAYLAAALFTVGWTIALGKDLHWDGVNYHLYLGYSALTDRFPNDFFGAGTPSYVNPYAYVPLYLMSRAGVPALWMAVAFALVHAGILWLTWELAMVVTVRDQRDTRFGFALLALLLVVINPVFLHGVGSTFTDLSIGVVVVGGWLAIAHALARSGNGSVAMAGALLGIATALKLSNAAYALAAVPVIAMLPCSPGRRLTAELLFGTVCALTFALVALPWAWPLWREFGNPFFPFLNHWFDSPDFTSAPLRSMRFLPSSWWGYITRPFDMLAASSMIHTEARSPDLRYVALLFAIVGWGIHRVMRARAVGRGTLVAEERRSDKVCGAADEAGNRVLTGLIVGLAISWCLWLVTSGNSRYFLSMSCVASVVLAAILQRSFQRWPDTTVVAILLLVGAQIVQLVFGADLKRESHPWGGPWLSVEVPERFRNEPYFYLSLAFQSGSAFMPYLHPDSGIMTVSGFHTIGPDGPGGLRAMRLIGKNAGRLRMLILLPNRADGPDALPGSPDELSVLVRRFGLRVDASDCDFFRFDGNLRGTIAVAPDAALASSSTAKTRFLTCRLVLAPDDATAYAREVRDVDAVLDRVEAACPKLFHPPRAVTEQRPQWLRTYNMGSEIQLWIDGGRVKYVNPVRGGDPIDIGTFTDWSKTPQPIDCSRQSAPAWGGLLK
jgi:hypothetical protein